MKFSNGKYEAAFQRPLFNGNLPSNKGKIDWNEIKKQPFVELLKVIYTIILLEYTDQNPPHIPVVSLIFVVDF